MTKAWISAITIQFDQDVLDTLVQVFTRIMEGTLEIEQGEYDLAPWEEFEHLTSTLRVHTQNSYFPVAIHFDFSDWLAYSSYLSHTIVVLVKLLLRRQVTGGRAFC